MEHGIKAIALAAIMLAHSTTADPVAWKAAVNYHFWMNVEEIGLKKCSTTTGPGSISRSSTGCGAGTESMTGHGSR